MWKAMVALRMKVRKMNVFAKNSKEKIVGKGREDIAMLE
jgi:hypothetical protein